jgi:hypothetical protein
MQERTHLDQHSRWLRDQHAGSHEWSVVSQFFLHITHLLIVMAVDYVSSYLTVFISKREIDGYLDWLMKSLTAVLGTGEGLLRASNKLRSVRKDDWYTVAHWILKLDCPCVRAYYARGSARRRSSYHPICFHCISKPLINSKAIVKLSKITVRTDSRAMFWRMSLIT